MIQVRTFSNDVFWHSAPLSSLCSLASILVVYSIFGPGVISIIIAIPLVSGVYIGANWLLTHEKAGIIIKLIRSGKNGYPVFSPKSESADNTDGFLSRMRDPMDPFYGRLNPRSPLYDDGSSQMHFHHDRHTDNFK